MLEGEFAVGAGRHVAKGERDIGGRGRGTEWRL